MYIAVQFVKNIYVEETQIFILKKKLSLLCSVRSYKRRDRLFLQYSGMFGIDYRTLISTPPPSFISKIYPIKDNFPDSLFSFVYQNSELCSDLNIQKPEMK